MRTGRRRCHSGAPARPDRRVGSDRQAPLGTRRGRGPGASPFSRRQKSASSVQARAAAAIRALRPKSMVCATRDRERLRDRDAPLAKDRAHEIGPALGAARRPPLGADRGLPQRPLAADQRPEQRVVLRAESVAHPERAADPHQDLARARRRQRLGQGDVDLRRRPARKRDARGDDAVAVAVEPVNRHPGGTEAGGTGGRHDQPELREAPRLVERQLAAPDVGGLVHFQHHVRQVVLADDERAVGEGGPARVEVDRLVRLHHAIGPPGRVRYEQVDRPERPDRRAAHGRDQSRQLRQPARRRLVDAAGRLGNDPRGLRPRGPVLQPAVEIRETIAKQGHRPAPGELEGLVRRPAAGARRRARLRRRLGLGGTGRGVGAKVAVLHIAL